MQYASAEATKRSGGADPSKKVLNGSARDSRQKVVSKPGGEKVSDLGSRRTGKVIRNLVKEEGDVPVTEKEPEGKRGNGDQRGKKWEVAGRPRPGAALAMAKREKVAIVEGRGKKIVFD